MKYKPKYISPKLVLVNTTTLSPYDEEKCKYCGYYGCNDRGYTLTVGDPPKVLAEAKLAQQLMDRLGQRVEENKEEFPVHFIECNEPKCVRKLKKKNAESVVNKLKLCGPDCHLNCDWSGYGGMLKQRDEGYHCPFRERELPICERNLELDGNPLVCFANDGYDDTECQYHEEAYRRCFKRKEGEPCYDLNAKYNVADPKNDFLLVLAHRFSAAECRFCETGTCRNEQSPSFEGMCTLKGLMAPCGFYAPVAPDHAYTEGVVTYVASADGKDDRKIFNTSSYAAPLSKQQRYTLCIACRISHSIAKATGLKCLGVRRLAKTPLFNEDNPLRDRTVQINYLYLTHPEDVAKYNPELISQAVYDALTLSCYGLGCEEYEECRINKE